MLLVGGYVRDFVLGIPSKDADIEIYGLSYPQILRALQPYFRVGQVGQSFSVLKVDNEIDLTIPRRERKTGTGHKAFDVQADPTMTFKEAAARRDFTINAIGMRLDGSFCDPYDGLGDLKRGVLRATTEAFCEDPLRVLRGMQFAARFGFTMDDATIQLCKRIRSEFSTLSPERLYMEWFKWAAKGAHPDLGLEVLRQTTWLECFPALAALVGVIQDPKAHPEGDVFEHTKATCKAAADIAVRYGLSENERVQLLFAALLHDVGKPETTTRYADGSIHAPGHAEKGEPLAWEFLRELLAPNWLLYSVPVLVREHSYVCKVKPTPTIVRRFSTRLQPTNIRMWHCLISADDEGRGRHSPDLLHDCEWLEMAKELGVDEHPPQPLLLGRDLIARGLKPGTPFGEILREAMEAQLDGAFTDREGACAWLDERLNR